MTFRKQVKRQGVLGGVLAPASSDTTAGAATTAAATTAAPTTAAATTAVSTTPVSSSTPVTTQPTTTPTTAPTTAPTTTPTTAPTTSKTTSSTSTTPTSATSTATTVITSVITPVTTIVVGTSTLVSSLPATTVVSSTVLFPTGASDTSGQSGLSSGAKTGIIVGSVVGGLALLGLLIAICVCGRRKRRRDNDRANNIRWPEIAASADDRAALYPESTHPTGRSGLGGDMEELDGAGGVTRSSTIAGASFSSSAGHFSNTGVAARQPALPQIPASIYDQESTYAQSAAPTTPYSTASYASHQPLAPGPASIDYLSNRGTTSPSRHDLASSSSHGHEWGAGEEEPSSNEEAVHAEEIERPLSPTEHGFGGGYNERTRLGVVNH